MRKVISSDSHSTSSLNERIRRMERRHRDLDSRIEELGRRALLTPAEQREISELKKHKLATKDQITAMKRAIT
ncbi:MAG: YdcH family protein [Polyangiaceae bacterium]